mgnify:CR=1 FL=1
MPTRPLPALVTVLLLQACLPPPRAWLQAGPGGDDTGPGAAGDDTAEVEIPCRSLAFDEGEGHLTLYDEHLTDGSFITSDSFTVEFYSWFTSQVSGAEPRTLAALGADRAWRIAAGDDALIFSLEGASSEIRAAAPDTGWHHIALVHDRPLTEMRMYLDGAQVGAMDVEDLYPLPRADQDALHVARAHGDGLSWPGPIDQLRFGLSVRHEGGSTQIDAPRSQDGWQGVWHFSGDITNTLSGEESSAGHAEFMDFCPTSGD